MFCWRRGFWQPNLHSNACSFEVGGAEPPPHSRSLHESQRKGKASAQQSPGAEGTHGLHFFFAGEEPDSAATPTPLCLANEGECLNFSSFWWGAGECVCVCRGETIDIAYTAGPGSSPTRTSPGSDRRRLPHPPRSPPPLSRRPAAPGAQSHSEGRGRRADSGSEALRRRWRRRRPPGSVEPRGRTRSAGEGAPVMAGPGAGRPRQPLQGLPPLTHTRAPAPAPLTVIVVADFLLAAALTVRHRAAAPGPSRGWGEGAGGRGERRAGTEGGKEGGGGHGRAGTRDAGPRAARAGPIIGSGRGRASGKRPIRCRRGNRGR